MCGYFQGVAAGCSCVQCRLHSYVGRTQVLKTLCNLYCSLMQYVGRACEAPCVTVAMDAVHWMVAHSLRGLAVFLQMLVFYIHHTERQMQCGPRAHMGHHGAALDPHMLRAIDQCLTKQLPAGDNPNATLCDDSEQQHQQLLLLRCQQLLCNC